MAPERAWVDPPQSASGVYARRPLTSNPDAEEMRFAQAAADRDVAARLAAYNLEVAGEGENPIPLDLIGAWRTAQERGREFLSAEEEYVFAAIRLLIERHRWSPRLFNTTTAMLSGDGDDGNYDAALNVINELRATQRLPFGGEVEARWLVNATRALRDAATEDYVQSSEIALSANIPLLRDAGMIAQEDIIQAERDLVYAARDFEQFRRSFLVDIASDYFDLLQTRARIANQQAQLESQRRFLESTAEKVRAGRLRGFQERLVRNQVLQAESSLNSLMEQYNLQIERFKIRLGLPVEARVRIETFDLTIPEPEISLSDAAHLAVSYRLDLQNRRDRLDDSRRAVLNAKNQLLPDLDVSALGAIPTDPDRERGGLEFDTGDARYSLGVTFGLPLDREIERLNLRQRVIDFERAVREYEQFRDNVLVDARASVRSIDLARSQLELAEAQVAITEERLEEQRINEDIVDPQERIDTEIELLNARNARDQALTDLRNAVLNYLLQTGQLRVEDDGTLKPLPGMGS